MSRREAKIKVLSDELSHHQALVRAGLDLRQWESSNTAERMRHLISDRDHSRAEALSSMQLSYLRELDHASIHVMQLCICRPGVRTVAAFCMLDPSTRTSRPRPAGIPKPGTEYELVRTRCRDNDVTSTATSSVRRERGSRLK